MDIKEIIEEASKLRLETLRVTASRTGELIMESINKNLQSMIPKGVENEM